jgi:glycosyltransferase involved in cell wall biosynthesis
MKIALVHDWLNGMRGGEKVLEVLCDLFPDADVYTLFYEPDRVSEKIRRMNVRASALQRFPAARRRYRNYLPLYPWAIERFDMSIYDVVVSSSHCAAKGVRLYDGQLHVCYCHAPMRYVWDQYESYFGGPNRWKPSSIVMRLFIKRLRRWDVETSKSVTAFVANSAAVAERIMLHYGRQAIVVHPPIDTARFHPIGTDQSEYFLTVSALVPYKRIDLAIEACRRMSLPLVIVGEGPERRRLQQKAGRHARFLGWVSDDELVRLYNGCRALLFPGEEDFGITAVEAQACGRPVIALRKGGVVETVLDKRTGLFFNEPTVEALGEALERFQSMFFDRGVIRAHAEKFGGDRCRRELDSTIRAIFREYGLEAPAPLTV